MLRSTLALLVLLAACAPTREERGEGEGSGFTQSGTIYVYEAYYYNYNRGYEMARFTAVNDLDVTCADLDQWGNLVGQAPQQYATGWLYKGDNLDSWNGDYVATNDPACPFSIGSGDYTDMRCVQVDAQDIGIAGYRNVQNFEFSIASWTNERVRLSFEDEYGRHAWQVENCGVVRSYPYVGVMGPQEPRGPRAEADVWGLRFR